MLSLTREVGPPDEPAAAGPPRILAALVVAEGLAGVEAEWRDFGRRALGHVFQEYDYLAPWMARVGAERKVSPRIVIGRDGAGETLFLLPFGLRHVMGIRVIEWLGGEHADYHGGLYAPDWLAGLAADPVAFAAFPDIVMRALRGSVDLVHLQRQPERLGGWLNPFASWHARPYPAQSHLTRIGKDWDAYYRAKRNSSSRRHDRGKWQKMEALGPVRFIDADEPRETLRVLAAMYEQKSRSLAGRGAQDFFRSPAVRDFYAAIALKPWPRGPSHVSAIECDGRIVATNWGLVRNNRYYYVMTSYADGPVAAFSPGRALMYHLMRWCMERGIDEFDFTIGDEDFKTQWCEEQATLHDSLAALTVRGAAAAAATHALKAVKRTVKRNPRLHKLAWSVRRRLAKRP